jgi:hypothetical protein
MPVIAILALLAWGLIVGIIPSFILIEIFHWIANKQEMRFPLLKGITTCLLIGIIVIISMIKSSNGESGLVAVSISPFIFSGFALGGIMLGLTYKCRGKPFFVRKMKKTYS